MRFSLVRYRFEGRRSLDLMKKRRFSVLAPLVPVPCRLRFCTGSAQMGRHIPKLWLMGFEWERQRLPSPWDSQGQLGGSLEW